MRLMASESLEFEERDVVTWTIYQALYRKSSAGMSGGCHGAKGDGRQALFAAPPYRQRRLLELHGF